MAARGMPEQLAIHIAGHFAPGTAQLLEDAPKSSSTDLDISKCLALLRRASEVNSWGVYLKLAIPRVNSASPMLPTLVYVGSATTLGCVNESGIRQRARSHIWNMQTGNCQDAFWQAWEPHSEDYELYILELWSLQDFRQFAATPAELQAAYDLTVYAESLLIDLFAAHSVLQCSRFIFTSAKHQPCNVADPMRQGRRTARRGSKRGELYACTHGLCDVVATSELQLLLHNKEHSTSGISCPAAHCTNTSSTIDDLAAHYDEVHSGESEYDDPNSMILTRPELYCKSSNCNFASSDVRTNLVHHIVQHEGQIGE